MTDLIFLDDPACLDVIKRLAQEAAKTWAPAEVELVNPLVDTYVEQVRAQGQLLYPARGGGRPLGFGNQELWLLIILPILTGFLGNLLATAGVWTLQGLREKMARTPSSKSTPSRQDLDPSQIQVMLQAGNKAKILSRQQVEQLAASIVFIMNDFLVSGQANGVTNGDATP